MQEMLLTGRGGEGVVLASQILADTFARAGYWVQSFPEFKAERRGAPISAFLRWDADGPIRRRYKVRECDVLVAISASPPPARSVAMLRPGGLLLVNRETRFPHRGDYHLARVPGSQVARRNRILSAEGRPMGNVAVLGAAVRLLLPDGLGFLEEAIRARMGSLAEPNILAAREGYRLCTRQHTIASDTPYELEPQAPRPPLPVFPVSRTDSRINHTGSWSLERPVLLDPCNACGICALFCPESAMTRHGKTMLVDYLYCKGCGICEEVCPVRGAIAMEEVPA